VDLLTDARHQPFLINICAWYPGGQKRYS